MEISLDTILRLTLSIIAGGLIGAEREYVSKAAGFRTLMLISLGACLFTIFSIHIGISTSPDRIASNIVTGIGFLGAGVIFKDENRVKGLTTAATVWVTAAIGMGIGGGYYLEALAATALTFLALSAMRYFEDLIERTNQQRHYRIVCAYRHETLARYEQMLTECGLSFKRSKQNLQDDRITGTWTVSGSEKKHERFIQRVLQDPEVKEFDF